MIRVRACASNLKEIAAVLGVTESRICQLHSQSIARLRSKLRQW
jgi:RNA polymerase sigma factor for flagellar operon FliA